MYNFQIETSFVNLNPPSKKSWIRPCFYHLFYFIYMGQPIWDPYGTRLHCPYGSHTGAHMGPIWISYRLLAGFFKRQISAKPECSRGEGGGSLFFSACVGSSPAATFHPQKYQEFQAPKIFYPSLRIYENIRVPPLPPPPPPPRECSCIVIPGAPMSQIKLA